MAIRWRSPTATTIAGTQLLAEKKRARRRRPEAAPSTPTSAVAPPTPWRYSAATTPTWASEPPRRAPRPQVDRQLHLAVGLVLRAAIVPDQTCALHRQQAPAGDRRQLGGDGLDPLGAVDRDRQERQVLGEREQAVALEVVLRAEALRPAQQHAGGEPPPLEEVEDDLGEEAAPVAVVLAEVEAKLERILARAGAHSSPPIQWPNATAARPARSERLMFSQSARASPTSPSRWDSNIQVEKVV